MSELKPCPFCGSKNLNIGLMWVNCLDCTVRGPYHPKHHWNTRANPDPTEQPEYIYVGGRTFWDWLSEGKSAEGWWWRNLLRIVASVLLALSVVASPLFLRWLYVAGPEWLRDDNFLVLNGTIWFVFSGLAMIGIFITLEDKPSEDG